MRSCVDGLVPFPFLGTARVERMSETMLRMEQEVRSNSQLLKSIYWLG